MAPARTGTNWAGASLSCCPSTPHAAHTALRRITFHCIQTRPPQSSSRQRARAIWCLCSLGHSWKACSSSQQKCLSPWEQGSRGSSSARVAEEQRRLLQPVRAHYQGQLLSGCGRRKNKVLSPLSPGFPFHSVYWAALFLEEGSSKKKRSKRWTPGWGINRLK